MQDLTIITKSILTATSDPSEIVEMAYQLGVSHGRSQILESKKKAVSVRRVYDDKRRNISMIAKCRSNNESRWLDYLFKHYWKVLHEPKKFPVLIDGKYTSYTPDFQCICENGKEIWIETKVKNWAKLMSHNCAGKDYRQLRCMQECVAHHKILLYICAGKPPPGSSKKFQVLGLNSIKADHPETLVDAPGFLAEH